MPKFKNGVVLHQSKKKQSPYHRLTAGPNRGQYVHKLIAEARAGRKLTRNETVEHKNGDTLDLGKSPTFDNLVIVPRPTNTALMHERKKRGPDYYDAGY